MDIAAMATMLNQAKVQQQAGISIMKMAMSSAENKGNMIKELATDNIKMMEMSVNPHLGGNVDIRL